MHIELLYKKRPKILLPESYVSLKGNDKTISILLNSIKGNIGSKNGAMVN